MNGKNADMNDSAGVGRLRRAFDESFAAPPREAADMGASYLAVTVNGNMGYAVPVKELLGAARLERLCCMPGASAAFRGLTSMNGRLIAVFSLGAVLGQAGAGEERWMLRLREDPRMALSCEAIGGLYQPARRDVLEGAAGPFALEVIRPAGGNFTVLDVPALARVLHGSNQAVRGGLAQGSEWKERLG